MGQLLILIVDDNDDLRFVVAESLRMRGVQVIEAKGGREAVDTLGTRTGWDAVITDVHMPDGDGMWLLEQVKRRLPGLPVILMTGAGERQQIDPEHRCDACLMKPFDGRDVIAALKSCIPGVSDADFPPPQLRCS